MAVQRGSPHQYATNARFVSELGEPVLELLAPKPGERVLDLGCGDGALTEKLVDAGCIVVAVDASPEQVAAARECGLDARVENAESLSYSDEFDAVFSNAALHWVKDQDATLAGVCRALKPGGRFVGEFGGTGNVGTIKAALYDSLQSRGFDPTSFDPWFFPTTAQYENLMTCHGLTVKSMELFSRPTPLPGDISGWLYTMAQSFLAAAKPGDRLAVVDEVREALRSELYDPHRGWIADYVRLRFEAYKRAV